MTSDGEFREAVRRLHRAKDAAYRDAWKRRGEVISILANIARKVDRLEYGLDGAPATAGESWLDTAADLLVYCLKYQAYLADLDRETAVRLFGGSGIRPPYSDSPPDSRRCCRGRTWGLSPSPASQLPRRPAAWSPGSGSWKPASVTCPALSRYWCGSPASRRSPTPLPCWPAR